MNPLAAPVKVPHSDRNQAGAESLDSPAAIAAYRQRYATLGDLYAGEGEAQLGALLIDAHLAANAAGITATARPEDTVLDPASGDLLVSFTSGMPGSEGTPDPAIFEAPKVKAPGMRAGSCASASRATTASAGKWWPPAVNQQMAAWVLPIPTTWRWIPGALWMVTDIGTGSQNNPQFNGGAFGNNSCWVIPSSGLKPAKPSALPPARWNASSRPGPHPRG